ncbi:MAG: triose-phosphate isomerase [Planctomycetota bacterium]
MYKGITLKPPIFEIGLKGYAYGEKALALAMAADRISGEQDVQIVFDPQYVDIPLIASRVRRLLVFAQHMDPVAIGRGHGGVLPEAIKAAGAAGVILNHAERPMTLADIAKAIRRADEVGLVTLACADSPEEAAAVAQLSPNMILAEPPALIGTGKSVGSENREFIANSMRLVKAINPEIIVFNSAGIRTAGDVAEVVRLGAEATGSTSGILKADDPVRTMEDMVIALKRAWTETH